MSKDSSMDKQQFIPVAFVVVAAISLALWTSACSSDSSTGPGGGGGGQLSANPSSVSVAVNANTSVSITGGGSGTTYAVQTAPDTNIARVISLVTNTVGSPPIPVGTLTLRGVTADSVGTSTTIRDGSLRTVTIPIRVTP